jgi:hypothetical protein
MDTWLRQLRADPRPWLLEDGDPAVKHLALRQLMDIPQDAVEVQDARARAMATNPIASILAAQSPVGFWQKPGAGYATKYRGTVWQLIFLAQLGADGSDARIQAACEYVLAHTQTNSGGFGASGVIGPLPPPPSRVIHCLNGNLLDALIRFGRLDDERMVRAVDWQARSITGDGFDGYYQSGTSGPGFCCAANDKEPCAWGAVKALRGLAAIPAAERPPQVARAIERGLAFLLSRDPAVADYPMPRGNTKPNNSWYKLGFPSGYVTDVLQNVEVLCDLGLGRDPRLSRAIELVLRKQDGDGRWKNDYAYNGKTWVDFEKQGAPSKWVTLRACTVLKAVFGS